MHYPFYTWLSIFGVMIQFVQRAIRILFVERPFSFYRWVQFFGRFFIAVVGFMLPMILFSIPFDAISQYNATLGLVWNAAMLVVLYITGVLGARYLYRWSVQDKQ